MGKSKFGGDKYKPHQLGPEPATPNASGAAPKPPAPTPTAAASAEAQPSVRTSPKAPASEGAEDKLRDIKVQFSSRISYAADQQLTELTRRGHSRVALLAEALNLLFKKHGLDDVA